ncbi:MAG: sensor histidine kinase [Acidimicrobiales bacterium]
MARWPAWTWVTGDQRRTDWLIAAAGIGVGTVGLVFGGVAVRGHYRGVDAGAVALMLVIVVPLAWRRVRPDLVLAVAGSAEFMNVIAGYRPGLAWLAIPLAVYTLAACRQKKAEVWPLLLWIAEVVSLARLAPHHDDPWNLLAVLGVTAAAWLRGDWTRTRRVEHERDREAKARQAVVDERARIARELHDVVAHALGVIVMQAGGARVMPHLAEDDARRVLEVIERTGRQAFAEMRRLVDVLRDDAEVAGLAPQPTVAALETLAGQMSAAGLPVTVEVHGEGRLAQTGVEVSAYRIVQEALTNSLKHAGSRARVRVDWSAEALSVEVTDDGPAERNGAARSMPADSGGHGLVGMRERVALYGGELEAGPRPEGGFRVAARLPLGGGQ